MAIYDLILSSDNLYAPGAYWPSASNRPSGHFVGQNERGKQISWLNDHRSRRKTQQKLRLVPCISSIPNWLKENIRIFFNKMSETLAACVGVITHCSINSKRLVDTAFREMCILFGMLCAFSPRPPFIQHVAVQPDSIHLNGRFVNV